MNCERCGAANDSPRCASCGHLTVRHPRAGQAPASGAALEAEKTKAGALRLLFVALLLAMAAAGTIYGGNAYKLAGLRAEFHQVVEPTRYRRITGPAMVEQTLKWGAERGLALGAADVEVRIRPGVAPAKAPAKGDDLGQAAQLLRERFGTAPVLLDVRARVQVTTLGWKQVAILAVQSNAYTAPGGFVPTPASADFGRLTTGDAERRGAELAHGNADLRMAIVRPLLAAIEAQKAVERALPSPSPQARAALTTAAGPLRVLGPTVTVTGLGPDGPFALAGYLRLLDELHTISAPGASPADRADYQRRRDKVMGRLARLLDAHGVHLSF